MAALFRIAVVSAIFYLARFALAHTERKHSDSQKEDSVSASEGSSEKILIESGVPLRGRTIHHTAWSEEDKVLEPNQDTTLQQAHAKNGEKKFYDSWSLAKAFNYILSFIYDMEDGTSNLVHTSPENSEKSKIQNERFDERMVPETHAKEKDGNISNQQNKSMYNNNPGGLLQSTPSYIIAYFQNQNIEWFENGNDNENQYTDYYYEDNELLYEDEDSEYEVELSNESAHDSAIDEEQMGQLQGTNFKSFTGTKYETEKTRERGRFLKNGEEKKKNEPEFNTERVLQKSRESEQEEDEEKIRRKLQEDDIKSIEDPKFVHTSNNRVQETVNEMKVVKKMIHHSETPITDEHSIDNENSSIETNLQSNVNEVENINWIEKQKSEKNPIQSKNQDYEVSSSETVVSILKHNENPPESKSTNTKRENTRSHTQLKNNIEYNAKQLEESEIPHGVSNDVKNDSNEDASSEKRTIPTSITRKERHPQMKEEKNSIKVKISDSHTHGRSKPVEVKGIIAVKPTTSVTQRYSQHKKQSLKSDYQVQNKKIELPVGENNQRGKIEGIINQNVTTEYQYKKVLKDRHHFTATVKSIADKEKKSFQSRGQGNRGKETVQLPQKESLEARSNLKNVMPSKKPLNEKDTKHAKSKIKMLSDLYIDLEPDDANMGSYNYLLDSFEFIRVTENNQNKVKKKPDISVRVLIKDDKLGAQEKATTILSENNAPFKNQSEPEMPKESQKVFGTILEYLYKNSNSSFLLSLKEYNSSEF